MAYLNRDFIYFRESYDKELSIIILLTYPLSHIPRIMLNYLLFQSQSPILFHTLLKWFLTTRNDYWPKLEFFLVLQLTFVKVGERKNDHKS